MVMQFVPRVQNVLLADLPLNEWNLILPSLQNITLSAQAKLQDCHELIDHAYFLLSGSVSLLVELADSFSVETAQIGNEGMIGVPLVLGQARSIATATVQIPGVALRIAADTLVKQLALLPTLHRNLLHYAGVQIAQSMQFAACNAHHKLDARLARCLLGLHDRCQGDDLALSHESLATLLCAHRPSVSISIKRLERLGLLHQGMGSLTIINRYALEQASCECYAIMRDLPTDGRPGY